MEHKNAERHSGKVYRLFELLGHTEVQLYIAEIAVLITLLIGTAVYILLLRVLPDTSWLEGCQIRRFTGVICPACGTTRAVLAILHGPGEFRLGRQRCLKGDGRIDILCVNGETGRCVMLVCKSKLHFAASPTEPRCRSRGARCEFQPR